MKRVLLLAPLVAACTGPDYQPKQLPWQVHTVVAGGDHTLVLTETDTALDAGTVESDGADVPLPTDPSTNKEIPLELPTATAISVGAAHACIVSSAQVTCWGDNTSGALGAHRACSTDGCVLPPGVMPTLPPMRALAAGDNFTCALANDSTVMCWGENTAGQLGGSVVSSLDAPQPVRLPDNKILYADRILATESSACAIDKDQHAWCWGQGYGPTPRLLAHSGVVDVSVNGDHGCVLAADGLTCWGDNINGQIDSTSARACAKNSPCMLPETPIALGAGAQRVVVGERHTCVLGGNGDVTCFGSNEHGQLARSDAFLVGDPGVAFSGATNLVSGSTHVCALTSDHDAWCWGDR